MLEKYKTHFLGQYIYVAWPLKTLANLWGKLGNYEKAKTLLEQVLLIFQRNYGDDHVETALVLKDLGVIHLLYKHLEIAEDFICKSLAVFEKNKHPEKYMCLEALSQIYIEKSAIAASKGDEQKTREYQNQAVIYLNQALDTIKMYFVAGSLHEKRVAEKLKEFEESAQKQI
jgi:tetratricopeptide (TPR) repeat protein